MTASDTTKVQRLLALLQQKFERVSELVPLADLTAGLLDAHPRKDDLNDLLATICSYGTLLDELLQLLSASALPLVEIPQSLRDFYENEYRPNRERLESAHFGHLDISAFVDSEDTPGDVRHSSPVNLTLDSALHCHETTLELNPDFEGRTDFDIEACRKLLALPFFEPDEWLERLRSITPIFVSRKPARVPSHVRLRVSEVIRTFIFGSFLASAGLARSLLEYALRERASSLGFQAYETRDDGRKRNLDLVELIERAAATRPALLDDMERVRELGNRTLHPSKHYDVISIDVRERDALRCIGALRSVLSDLYSA